MQQRANTPDACGSFERRRIALALQGGGSHGAFTGAYSSSRPLAMPSIAKCSLRSREDPTLVCQELSLTAERACDLKLRAMIDAVGISGRAAADAKHAGREQTQL
jgi:hypothetical protein